MSKVHEATIALSEITLLPADIFFEIGDTVASLLESEYFQSHARSNCGKPAMLSPSLKLGRVGGLSFVRAEKVSGLESILTINHVANTVAIDRT